MLLLCCCALLAHARSKSADDACRKIDYAELKDTPKDKLYDTYCLYTGFAEIEYDAFYSLLKLDSSAANGHRLQAAQCGQEADRVFGVLERTYKVSKRPKKADCDAHFAAEKARREKAK